MIHVAVCVPAYKSWDVPFGFSLASCAAQKYTDVTLSLNVMDNAIVCTSRNELVKMALEDEKVDYLMWFDSDMVFPPTTIAHLMNREKDIIGANYIRRLPPYTPVTKGLDGEFVWTKPDSSGIEEVEHTGFGVMLIKADVFRKTQAPWFDMGYADGRFIGEDVVFCKTVRDAGYKIFIDHDLAKAVSHVGSFNFGMESGLKYNGVE